MSRTFQPLPARGKIEITFDGPRNNKHRKIYHHKGMYLESA